MEGPQVTRTLKQDQFGRVELLVGPQGEVVRRVACGDRIPGSRGLAHVLLRREARALFALEGLAGVPRGLDLPDHAAVASPDGSVPRTADVLLRSWIAGVPLHDAMRLPSDYFELLEELVRALHARGVCHNDLHKEPNLLVGPDGRPGVVDFQLASVHRGRGRRFQTRVREDLRHVAKHRRRYFAGTARTTEEQGRRAEARRSLLAGTWAALGKPVYNFVTRRLLHTSDSEPRRPSEGPWPTWDPPLGPADPRVSRR